MIGFQPCESWALDAEEWCLEWGSQLKVCNSISQRLKSQPWHRREGKTSWESHAAHLGWTCSTRQCVMGCEKHGEQQRSEYPLWVIDKMSFSTLPSLRTGGGSPNLALQGRASTAASSSTPIFDCLCQQGGLPQLPQTAPLLRLLPSGDAPVTAWSSWHSGRVRAIAGPGRVCRLQSGSGLGAVSRQRC